MKNNAFYFFIVIICYFVSCDTDQKLNRALSLAGANRPELEKVLAHYEKNPDPLKLEAARFLIQNMPGHRSYVGKEIINYYKEMDQILSVDTTLEYKNKIIEEIITKYPYTDFQTAKDIEIISSDFLIRNIDSAFDKWENGLWAKHMNFKQFCEMILPYKCFEYQQLDSWRDTLSVKFDKKLPDKWGNDQCDNSAYYAATQLNSEIRALMHGGLVNIAKPAGYPFLNSSIYKVSYGDCYGSAKLAVMVMRSHGIPVFMDYIPYWGQKDGSHAWYTLLSDNGIFMPFSWGLTSNPGDVFFPYDPIPKIYRYTYTANEKIVQYLNNAVYKHPFFEVFEQDVTCEYIQTSDLSIPLLTNRLKDKYVYLSIFKNGTWAVVDVGMTEDDQAIFTNVGRNIVYMILGYDGKKLIPVSHPFFLEKNGEIKCFIGDTTKKREIHLLRKYPRNTFVVEQERRILGGEIQASDDANFVYYDSLYKIADLSYPDMIPLNAQKKYRYWRYYSEKGSYCNIAELQFYEKGTDSIARGRIIGTEKLYENKPDYKREMAFDGDWLTYFHPAAPDSGWVGLDFGEPVSIDRARCIPRSDDNNIRVGDIYELKYWEQTGWKSLGVQKANDKVLHYNSVPDKALLLLINHTRGKQERVFTYEKDKQKWR